MKRSLAALLVLAPLALAACGGGSSTTSQPATQSATASQPASTASQPASTATQTQTSSAAAGSGAYKNALKRECGALGTRLLAITNESVLVAKSSAATRGKFENAGTQASSAATSSARRLAALTAPSHNLAELRALVAKANSTAQKLSALGREASTIGTSQLVRLRNWVKSYYGVITPMIKACGAAVKRAGT